MSGSATTFPRVNIRVLSAELEADLNARNGLILGQNQGGTATAGALVDDVHTMSNEAIAALFGNGHLYWSIQNWMDGSGARNGGKVPKLSVIAVASTGAAASRTSTITGLATENGKITFSSVDEKRFAFTVVVSQGDTATVIGDSLVSMIPANAPFTAANVGGVVTFTAKDTGALCNNYGFKTVGEVAGIAVADTAWTGGSGTPVVTTIFDNAENKRFTSVLWPEDWNGTLGTVAAPEILDRYNDVDIMDGVLFHGLNETFANNKATAAALNDRNIVLMGNNRGANAPEILQPADYAVAYFMAVADKRLTTGSDISSNVLASGLDTQGSIALATLPYANTPMVKMPVTATTGLYNRVEQSELKDAGFTHYGVNRAGSGIVMSDVVTTYKTDAAGNVDPTWKTLNNIHAASVAREIYIKTFLDAYAQTRVTLGDLVAGHSMENESTIKNLAKQIYRRLGSNVIFVAGAESEDFFAENLTVTLDVVSGTATIYGRWAIVTQLRDLYGAFKLSFSL